MAGAFISTDEANQMINDFIQNNFDQGSYGKVNVKSFLLDASLLRTYLQNTNIVSMKIAIGNSTTSGTKAPSLVLIGVDSSGNVVLGGPDGKCVLDHCSPCPPSCGMTTGNSAQDTIQ